MNALIEKLAITNNSTYRESWFMHAMVDSMLSTVYSMLSTVDSMLSAVDSINPETCYVFIE